MKNGRNIYKSAITRRDFLKGIGLATAALSMSGWNSISLGIPNKPNIIFIMADDLGYGDLGCYGQKEIKTPNINKLAVEGMRFTQCYAGAPVCAPSRSALMTGQHTGHTRVRGNNRKSGSISSFRSFLMKYVGVGPQEVPLLSEDVTVAEVLKQAGYVTGITGKWGLGESGSSGTPTKQGFDEWFGYLNQSDAHSYYPAYLWRNGEKLGLKGNQDGKREQYSHDLFTQFALDFIQRHKKEPYFLYLPYTIPHRWYEIPSTEPYSNKPWKEDEKVYAAMITRMDRDVGRILVLLKELGIDKRSVVFFTSDNGAFRRWEGRFDSSGPLRGHKTTMYEGGLRTPMIVRWPGIVPSGVVSDQVWYFPDVLPTLAELAGVDIPSGIDGISILPALMGKKQALNNRFLYWESHEYDFQQAARWTHWKAIRLALGTPLELYNLSEDISESHNVAAQNPKIVNQFEVFMKNARTESPYWPISH